jgi:Rieske Fe-S protein
MNPFPVGRPVFARSCCVGRRDRSSIGRSRPLELHHRWLLRTAPRSLGAVSTVDSLTRRDLLAGAGTGAALVLSACSPGGPSSTSPTSAALIPPGTELAEAAAVPVGGALSVTVNDAPVLVTRPEEGEVHAFSAVCTHQGCTVNPGDGELLCPCHQSRYDLATGEVLGGPAPDPLPRIEVLLEDGRVLTA